MDDEVGDGGRHDALKGGGGSGSGLERTYRCASHEMCIFGAIGWGASSVVRKAIHIPSHRIIALKKINIFEKVSIACYIFYMFFFSCSNYLHISSQKPEDEGTFIKKCYYTVFWTRWCILNMREYEMKTYKIESECTIYPVHGIAIKNNTNISERLPVKRHQLFLFQRLYCWESLHRCVFSPWAGQEATASE